MLQGVKKACGNAPMLEKGTTEPRNVVCCYVPEIYRATLAIWG